MSIPGFAKSFLLALYRSLLLRILLLLIIIFSASGYIAYFHWLLPLLNRSISENYFQQTGHRLQHDDIIVTLKKCSISINHLKDSANLWQADGVDFDIDCRRSFAERGLIANSIAVRQLTANPQQLENGSWNFDEVLRHVAAVNKSAVAKKTADDSAPVFIKKLTIVNSTINSNARALNNLPLVITPLNVTLTNIDLRKKSMANIALKADINHSTPLAISGTMDLKNLQGELNVDVSGVPFVWFGEILKPYVAMEILHGVIETHSRITINAGAPELITSNGKLTELKIRPTTMEQDAVKWKSLEWVDAGINLRDKSIKIPLLTLNGFDGQLIITKERTTNVQAMIIKPIPEAPSNPELARAPAQQATAEQPWRFTVDRLAVNNAALGFFDESLKPSFSAIVQQFSGDITNIANDPDQIAVFNLAGNVDGYAPVTLNGKANFFIEQPELEALFSFQKMDMGAFSPYSAEYAGWRIKKGLLSVDLHYRFDHGRIVGKNHVVIDHLEFGEKVRGTRLIDLPLRLGLSLLTDENGIAVLDADISGDPKDPAFNVRETIWRAFRNTLKKIATAPFRVIADLLKTKEDLGRIQFVAGESQLSEEAITKIKLLQEAMVKRPKMRLTVRGVYDENADVVALKHEQVKSALQKQGLAKEAILSRNADWTKAVDVFYQAQGLANPTASTDAKYEELALAQTVLPERLSNLAHERAQAVKQYFVLQLGVASEKLLLESDNSCSKTNICAASAVIFTLED